MASGPVSSRTRGWIDHAARLLGTPRGFVVTCVLSLATNLLPTEVATFILSLLAIALSGILIVAGSHSRELDLERDKAMHKKLDGIIAAIDAADDKLQGIEPDEQD